MKQVEEIFKPSTKDLFSIFSESGVVFQIPSYQRNYAWGTSELQRLLKDIEQGYERYDIKSDYQILCFLGSIITVNISDKIDTVSSPLNIVDGQQRLTSTLFLIQCLNLNVKKIFEKKLSIPKSISTWIADEIQEINQNTLECLFSRKKRENKACEYLPKIVREGVDLLSFRENKFKYDSPVSNYLHQYAVSVVNNIELFSWEKLDCKAEFLSLEVVLKTFEDSFNDENFLKMTEKQLYELLDNENRFYSLKDFDKKLIIQDLRNLEGDTSTHNIISKIVKLISFSKFIFFNVVITEVRTYEQYQFDAFESLNTTGVPLTALDIFRAKALSAYSENEQVSRHDIDLLDSIDKYIQSLPQKSRAKESRDIVSSFVLYIEGINPEEHLSWQRNKLIDLYNKAEQLNNIEVLIHSLKEIVDFRVDFWNEKNVVKQLEELTERDEILVYLDYFRQLNSTLLIPIVTRVYNLYYFKNKKSFVKQIKALMHFVVLWRLSHPNTASIDKVFKSLMLGNTTRSAFCVGLGPKSKILDEEGFINFLSNELQIKKINTFDLWSNKFKGNSIYTVSKPTARLAILACYHHSEIMSDQVTISKTKAKLSDQNDLLNITSWKSNRYKTLEHIAPQNMKNTNDWDQDIYSDGEAFSNSLGNLTLLPEAENTAIGNNTWHVKKYYLKCFTAVNKDEININITKLKLNGLSVKKSTIDIMHGNYALGLPVLSLLNIDVWNKNIIQNRQLNFSKLIWCQACVYLNLQNIENQCD